jgi:hypothetical protein
MNNNMRVLDQSNGLKRVENLSSISLANDSHYNHSYNATNCFRNAKMTFREGEDEEDIVLNRIEKKKSKWIL